MGAWRRHAVEAALMGVALAATVRGADAQSVRGRLTEAETGAPIPAAHVSGRGESGDADARTDSEGRFFLLLEIAGVYELAATHDDYAAMAPVTVEVEEGVELLVDLRLGRTVFTIEPLSVTGRRRDVRHDATFAGARVRRELFASGHSRRVLAHGDPEFVAATSANDMLRWMTPATLSGCRIVYWNGMLMRSAVENQVTLQLSPHHLQFVEFYRTVLDAPQGLRDVPARITSPSSCSVVALWERTEPVGERTQNWWLYGLGVSGVLLLTTLFLGGIS